MKKAKKLFAIRFKCFVTTYVSSDSDHKYGESLFYKIGHSYCRFDVDIRAAVGKEHDNLLRVSACSSKQFGHGHVQSADVAAVLSGWPEITQVQYQACGVVVLVEAELKTGRRAELNDAETRLAWTDVECRHQSLQEKNESIRQRRLQLVDTVI